MEGGGWCNAYSSMVKPAGLRWSARRGRGGGEEEGGGGRERGMEEERVRDGVGREGAGGVVTEAGGSGGGGTGGNSLSLNSYPDAERAC